MDKISEIFIFNGVCGRQNFRFEIILLKIKKYPLEVNEYGEYF